MNRILDTSLKRFLCSVRQLIGNNFFQTNTLKPLFRVTILSAVDLFVMGKVILLQLELQYFTSIAKFRTEFVKRKSQGILNVVLSTLSQWLSVRYDLSGCGFESRCSYLSFLKFLYEIFCF